MHIFDVDLHDRWKEFIPQSKFDKIFLVAAFEEFIKELGRELERGEGDSFIKSVAEEMRFDGRSIYIAHADAGDIDKDGELTINKNFSFASMGLVSSHLDVFSLQLDDSTISEVVKREYRRKVDDIRRLIELRRLLGTPELTVQQLDYRGWGRVLDIQASVEHNRPVLPFAQLAEEFLERTTSETYGERSIESALKQWKLSESEFKMLQSYGELEGQDSLLPEQGKLLFEILLKRMRLDEWRVVMEPNLAGITVNAKVNEVLFPEDRRLKSGEIIYICTHEMIHVIRGANGIHQPFRLALEGVGDYIETEEGLASLMEVVMQEPIAHPRRRLLAGRYYAIGLSLQAIEKKGVWIPKYSMQQIYDKLRGHAIQHEDAVIIVWRIMRGTSLNRKTTGLEIVGYGKKVVIPIAETFVKDVAYFSGTIQLLRWFLMRLGWGAQELDMNRFRRINSIRRFEWYPSYDDFMADFEVLKGFDQDKILYLIDLLTPSKIRLDMLEHDEWRNLFDWNYGGAYLRFINLLK